MPIDLSSLRHAISQLEEARFLCAEINRRQEEGE